MDTKAAEIGIVEKIIHAPKELPSVPRVAPPIPVEPLKVPDLIPA